MKLSLYALLVSSVVLLGACNRPVEVIQPVVVPIRHGDGALWATRRIELDNQGVRVRAGQGIQDPVVVAVEVE